MTGPGFMFGPWSCRWSEVFYLSNYSLAMVNLKPIVPGKVSRTISHGLSLDAITASKRIAIELSVSDFFLQQFCRWSHRTLSRDF